MHKILKIALLTILLYSCGVKKSIQDRPDLSSYTTTSAYKYTINDSLFIKGDNSLRKNSFGQWELVASGKNPLELGDNIGDLTQDLAQKQEHIFLSKVNSIVPSKTKQWLLRKFLGIYNRKIHKYVIEEYKAEIYGISQYASDEFNDIADKYVLSLYLHSAHDIGHALQDLALVGCSSFAVWDNKTPDGDLLIARNFDFYAGDEFAKNKIISFIEPSKGYKFMSVSWAGIIGVMSGMNEKGLTVTINAGKSDIPTMAKTPISLVTREILQYASNIKEAIAIAKKKEVFVSESIMVGSAEDNKAVLIEVSPKNFGVYEVENTAQLICSNHFQSKAYQEDKENIKWIKESHSKYRYDRMIELLKRKNQVTPKKAIEILRNKDGLHDKKIGYGNEKALNQLIAHHGIVFQPKKRLVWVSANPYQLGEFVAFQLDSVFKNKITKRISLSEKDLTIEHDPFLDTKTYKDYEEYRKESRIIEKIIEDKGYLFPHKLNNFVASNPESWQVYYLVGKYHYQKKKYSTALEFFEKALTKEITTVPDKENIENYIKKTKRRL
jgi:predicted choloylglycine hydrolase